MAKKRITKTAAELDKYYREMYKPRQVPKAAVHFRMLVKGGEACVEEITEEQEGEDNE